MEIIRRATIEEMMKLEGITVDATRAVNSIITLAFLLFLITFFIGLVHESTPLFVGMLSVILIAAASSIYYIETRMAPVEQATFNDHSYYLAIIDNSDDFEHESYRLVDHHKDNTYFVEAIQEDENQ